MQAVWDWVQQNEAVTWTLIAVSIATFIGTLAAIPYLVVRIPDDYFVNEQRRATEWGREHPALRLTYIVAKNTLGVVILLAGIAMLVLPGQGVLTLLIGLMLINFPGKFKLERWIISWRSVNRAANWIRRRHDRNPLILPDGADTTDPDAHAEADAE